MDVEPWQSRIENPLFHRAAADLECRVRSGEAYASEAVLADYPELAADRDATLELIYTEHVLRQESGVEVTLDEWVSRFPTRSQDLRQLFQVHEAFSGEDSPVTRAQRGIRRDCTTGRDEGQRLGRIGGCELLEEIGRGGMGIVYRARQVDLDRIVALKTICETATVGRSAMRRFQTEAESAGRLQHPHIVQIHDVDIDDDAPYITMEFVSGGNLRRYIRERPLRPRTSAELIECLARAVHYAHLQGIVHRDLKPENVLLAPSSSSAAIYLGDPTDGNTIRDGVRPGYFEPKITDFGLAKRTDNDDQQTIEGGALGTPGYMAPEQTKMHASSVGPACDVYALGAMLYDMLVGRPPFHAATVWETLDQVRYEEPIPPRQIQPAVPRDLETICLKCLHKQPARRFHSAAELADELRRFLDGKPIQSRQTSLWERCHKWTRRHPSLSALLVVAVCGALGVTWQWIRAETNRVAAERDAEAATVARDAERREHQRAIRVQYAHDVQLAHLLFLSNNATQALELLHACPEELRNWEWRYVHSLCQTERISFPAMPKLVRQISWSPDGRLLAAVTGEWGVNEPGRLNLWEAESGRLRFSIEGHPSGIQGVRFSHDGTRVATAGTRWHGEPGISGVKVWDTANGSQVLAISNANAFCVEYSPNGRILAIGRSNGDIALHDSVSGEEIAVLAGHTSIALRLSFRPDGRFLASAGRDGTMRVWDLTRRNQFAIVDGLGDVRHVAYFSQGRDIAVGTYSGTVRIYRQSESGVNQLATLSRATSLPVLRVSPDGQTLAMSALNEPLTFVDLYSERLIRKLPGHNGYTTAAEFSPNGRWIASGGGDGVVKIWDLAAPAEPSQTELEGPFISDLAFHPDGQQIALAASLNFGKGSPRQDQVSQLWDVRTKRVTGTLSGHTDWLTSVAYHASGKWLVTGSIDKTARLWDPGTEQLLQTFTGHTGAVTAVAFAGDLVATASRDGTIRLWDPTDGKEQVALSHDSQPVVALAVSADGLIVSVTENGTLWLWSATTGEKRGQIPGGPPGPARLAISGNGRNLATAFDDPKVTLWRIDTLLNQLARGNKADFAKCKRQLVGHTGPVTGIAFSPDGNRLVSTSDDRFLKLWDVETGQEVLGFAGLSHNHSRVAFSPTGDQLVQTGGNHIFVWHATGSTNESDDVALVRDWHINEMARAQAARNRPAMEVHLDELRDAELSHFDQWQRRATAFSEIGDWNRARADWDRAAALVFRDRNVLKIAYSQALVRLHQGDIAGYREHCQQLWRLYHGRDSRLQHSVIWSFCLAPDCGVSPDEFVAAAQRAARDPKIFGNINTLGACLYRAGRIDEAIETLHKSMQLQGHGGWPQDWAFLALCHASIRDMETATEYLLRLESWLAGEQQRLEEGETDEQSYWADRSEARLLIDEIRRQMAQSFGPR